MDSDTLTNSKSFIIAPHHHYRVHALIEELGIVDLMVHDKASKEDAMGLLQQAGHDHAVTRLILRLPWRALTAVAITADE